MSSLLSRHNLSYHTITGYLRGYEHTLPVSPEQWAQAESLGLPVGSLVLCLESVFANTSEGDAADTTTDDFKLVEMCVVVGQTSERPIVISITQEKYEMKFLEAVMARRAESGKQNATDFVYLLVEPAQCPSDSTVQEVGRLGRSYAAGGLRKDKNADGPGPVDPAIHLLTALGLKLEEPASKQPLDLAAFCYLLFEDSDPAVPLIDVQQSFRAIPKSSGSVDITSNEGPGEPEEQAANPTASPERPSSKEETDQLKDDLHSLLGLGGIFSAIADANPSRTESSTPAPPPSGVRKMPKSPEPMAKAPPPSLKMKVSKPPDRTPTAERSAARLDMAPPAAPPPSVEPSAAGAKIDTASVDGVDQTAKVTPPLDETGIPEPEVIPAEDQSSSQPPVKLEIDMGEMAATLAADQSSKDAENKLKPDITQEQADDKESPEPPLLKPRSTKTSEPSQPDTDIPLKPSNKPSPSATARAASKANLGEPPTVASGMESLVAKLEQQVARAASKLSAQVDEIRSTLESELQTLVEKASEAEQSRQTNLKNILARIHKQLETTTEESQQKLSDSSATGRYAIKQQVDTSQSTIDTTQASLLDELLGSCKELRQENTKLNEGAEERLNSLIEQRLEEVNKLRELICNRLTDISQDHVSKLQSRFDRLKERMSDQNDSISQSFEQNLASLNEDLAGVSERASEKLKSSKLDYEIALRQAVMICEIDLSSVLKSATGTVLAPGLRERKGQLKKTVVELERRFLQECSERATKQLADLQENIARIKQDLQRVLTESLSSLDNTAKEHETEIAELFNKSSTHIEEAGAKAAATFSDIENRISENDTISRKLVESSGTDTDPSLLSDKTKTVEKLQELRQQASEKLSAAIEEHCARLEEKSQAEQQKLIANKEAQIQSVRESARQAVSVIREAIQESFEAIQMIREKNLE